MRHFRRADFVSMPWKNGGGVTTQLAIWPAQAGMEDFDWRISSARVAAAGPFSRFDGVDRTLALLQGEAMFLQREAQPALSLTLASPPLVFPGEEAIHASLPRGPVADFNVMTRRTRCTHTVERLALDGELLLPLPAGQLFLYCARGEAGCGAGDQRANLAAGECLLLDAGENGKVRITAPRSALLYAVFISFSGNTHGN
jgi:uncharacterized protein